MDFINFTVLGNGILFDLSDIPGAGTSTAKYVFRSSSFHTITRVEVWDNKMAYTTMEDRDYNFSFNGTDFTKLKINGVEADDNYDLFTKFTSLL